MNEQRIRKPNENCANCLWMKDDDSGVCPWGGEVGDNAWCDEYEDPDSVWADTGDKLCQ